jgi:aquaporin Z
MGSFDVGTASPRTSIARQMLAESLGTFALTLSSCAMEVIAAAEHANSYLERGLTSGLVVLSLIYAVSDISGAHFNPAVSLAFALRGAFPWPKLPAYWVSQIAGAVAGAGCSRWFLDGRESLGVTSCKVPALTGLLIEATLTMLLVTVIIHTSKRKGVVGPQAALAVGATIVYCALWAGHWTGASMNPARSLGPALITLRFQQLWIYAIGPSLGAIVAVGLAFTLRGPSSAAEEESANGKAGAST